MKKWAKAEIETLDMKLTESGEKNNETEFYRGVLPDGTKVYYHGGCCTDWMS